MSSAARTIYVSTIIIVIGLSIMHSSMFTLNDDGNAVYGKRYSNTFEAAASLANSCPGDNSNCIANNIQTDGTNNVPNILTGGAPGPQGPKGDRGDAGPQGPIGPQGPQGLTGTQGPQGLIGPKGDTGATGPQGLQGLIGAQGPQGLTGSQGPQGLTGPKGDTGNTGPQGPQGPPGQLDQPVLGSNLVLGRTDITIPPGEQRAGTADCPPDTVAIGGEFTGSGAPGIYVTASIFGNGDPYEGIPPTSWFVAAENTGPDFQNFVIFAICAPVVE